MKMKKIIMLFVCINTFSQNLISDKNVQFNDANVKLFCKTWGFLKYYHPNVVKGAFNWENEFLNKIEHFKNLENKRSKTEFFIRWIGELGNVNLKKRKEIDKIYFENNFNLSWLNDTINFENKLIEKLNYLIENQNNENSFYVEKGKNGEVIEKNAPLLNIDSFPNQNERLLCLCQYWNTVEYFFPYKYLTDQKWENVLEEMIGKFKNVSNEKEFELSILELVNKTNDGHSIFKSKNTIQFFGTNFFPADTKIINDYAIIKNLPNEKLAVQNNLKKGDIILEINNRKIKDIINEKYKYLNGSNSKAKLRDTYYFLANGTTEKVILKIQRKDSLFENVVKRYHYDSIFNKMLTLEKYKILENNIGYINMAFLEMKDVDEMMNNLSKTKGIIIDLRNYPKFIPYNLAKRFITKETHCIDIIEPDLSFPGKFINNKSIKIKPDKKYYQNPIILLVNENTQSRAEFSAMLLQSGNNVRTVGSQTAGANGNMTSISISKKHSALISGTGIFYPNGETMQRKGVKIDFIVEETIEGIKEGKDNQLMKALELLK